MEQTGPYRPRDIDTDVERQAGINLRPYNTDAHEALRQHYAVPTPLGSPTHEADHSHSNIEASEDTLHETEPVSRAAVRSSRLSRAEHVGWRERTKYFTWTWFTMTMATGQLANVISTVPYRFPGIYAIGCIVFIFNIVLFLFNITMISLRFKYHPSALWSSLTHPTESLFVPASVISLGTVLLNITEYGTEADRTGTWLLEVMIIMFWIYCALAVLFSCGIYLVMWSTQTFTLSQMTPVWIFPAYPLLVIGPHAGLLATKILRADDYDKALSIIIGGFTLQGIGFMVSLMIYAAFLYRLMTNKLPAESLRPGMFISVGPSGFTISGVIDMGRNITRVIPADFMGVGPLAGTITMVAANWMGIWLWGLAIWFTIVSLGAHWSCLGHGKMHFSMTWYSFVFPNTGLTTATFAVAKALDNNPLRILGCIFTVMLCIVWIWVFGMMIKAIVTKQILWPDKHEDRTDHNWMVNVEKKTREDPRENGYDGRMDMLTLRRTRTNASRANTRRSQETVR